MPVTINGSTGISGVNGSAGSPALIGSDADTGLIFAPGQVSASLNGLTANVPLVLGTAQASTSGTVVDFTGIPSWAKRITVLFNGVSTSGTSLVLVQLGDSGGIENTGYTSTCMYDGGVVASSTAGFVIDTTASATSTRFGAFRIFSFGSGNSWVAEGQVSGLTSGGTRVINSCGGGKDLSDTLDRIRITTVNGTDTFDAGSVNIMYE